MPGQQRQELRSGCGFRRKIQRTDFWTAMSARATRPRSRRGRHAPPVSAPHHHTQLFGTTHSPAWLRAWPWGSFSGGAGSCGREFRGGRGSQWEFGAGPCAISGELQAEAARARGRGQWAGPGEQVRPTRSVLPTPALVYLSYPQIYLCSSLAHKHAITSHCPPQPHFQGPG